MSEHENGNFVLKFGQNQQKHQPFMAISDFALLYRIRRCGARFRLLSLSIPPVVFLENMVSIRRIGMGMQKQLWISFPVICDYKDVVGDAAVTPTLEIRRDGDVLQLQDAVSLVGHHALGLDAAVLQHIHGPTLQISVHHVLLLIGQQQ